MPDKSQADVAYGTVGLARRDPDYYAALVMNNALGQTALGGRLGDSIRERQAWLLRLQQLDAGLDAGPPHGAPASRARTSNARSRRSTPSCRRAHRRLHGGRSG
jgi:hypothetical protein